MRDLLIQAIRYGDQPEVRARLNQAVEHGVDRPRLQSLIEERALAHDAMDSSRVARVREEMERAEAKRLQPHYVESFFREAFRRLGGTMREREPRRYEVTNVPAPVRRRDRQIGVGDPVLARYERIAFEKDLLTPHGQPLAAFVCPGHPLLDAVLDVTLESTVEARLRVVGAAAGLLRVEPRAPAFPASSWCLSWAAPWSWCIISLVSRPFTAARVFAIHASYDPTPGTQAWL